MSDPTELKTVMVYWYKRRLGLNGTSVIHGPFESPEERGKAIRRRKHFDVTMGYSTVWYGPHHWQGEEGESEIDIKESA